MAQTRTVKKTLAVMEDLQQGIGSFEQQRGNVTYDVHRVDVPVSVTSQAAITALDPSKFSLARLSTGSTYQDYIYDETATSGIPSIGPGYWVQREHYHDTYAQYLTLAEAQASNLKVGQRVILTDYAQAVYEVVADSDTGGFYLTYKTGFKFKYVKTEKPLHSKHFGAKHDGATDDKPAISAMIELAKSYFAPMVVIDDGEVLLGTGLTLDLPDYANYQQVGTFTSDIDDDVVVRLGSQTRNTNGVTYNGVKVYRKAGYDTAGTSVGVQIRNLVNCLVDVRRVNNFRDGVYIYADKGNGGCSHNEITLGNLQNNRRTVYIYTDGGVGYCNENNLYGGNCNHTTDYPDVTTVHYEIGYNNYRNNNNRWYHPSFEDNNAAKAKCAIINGDNNLIYWPRLEHPNNQEFYEIEFTVNSRECAIEDRGFGLSDTNINDQGENNEYDTRNSSYMSRQTPDATGKGVIAARSTVTDQARIFLAQSLAGADTAYLRGDGLIYSALRGYFESGIRMSTSSGSLDDFGIYVSAGSPEGVISANQGSICLGKDGNLYKKSAGSGGGNTGWVVV